MPNMLPRHALSGTDVFQSAGTDVFQSAGAPAGLGATRGFHHGLQGPVRLPTRLFLTSMAVAAAALVTVALIVWSARTSSTGVEDRFGPLVPALAVGFLVAVGAALAVARVASIRLQRRVRALTEMARRYSAGAPFPVGREHGDDELGVMARALDQAALELARQVKDLSGQQTRTDAILGGMVEGVLVIDEQGRVQIANESVKRMLGIGSDPTGRFHVELIRHPEVARVIASAVAGDAGPGNEVTLNTDPPKVLLANARPFAANGERGVALVLHDVTEFRRADQVRQDFVANVSHELRTPLTAIRGGVEALLEGGSSRGTPIRGDYRQEQREDGASGQ